jgi:hypothetical protein
MVYGTDDFARGVLPGDRFEEAELHIYLKD